MEFRKTLANGMEVIADTNTHLHSFSAIVRIRAGSAYEDAADWGITHMMEHCVNRSLKWRYDEDFYGLMSRNGIRFDLYTSAANTEYQIVGSPSGIPMAADMLRKMFLPITLSDEEFSLEKDRVLAEIGSDRPGQDPFWETSTLGFSVQGTAERVEAFSQAQLNAYMESILVPGNVALCLTGCIDAEAAALLLEAAEAIPMYAGTPAPKALPVPADFGNRGIFRNIPAGANYLRFVFDADPRYCAPAAVELLAEILFEGLDGLLYQNLSEQTGLIYGYNWDRQRYRAAGCMEFRFAYDLPLLERILYGVELTLNQACQGIFDLDNKKGAVRAKWSMLRDNPLRLGRELLNQMELTDSPELPDCEAVTKEEIMACAERIFSSGVTMIWHQAEWEEIRKILEQVVAAAEGKE